MNSMTALAIIAGIVLIVISFVLQIDGKFMYGVSEQDPNSDFAKLTNNGQIMVIIGGILLALGSISLARMGKMAYDARKR
jgi:hypothetical protein